MIRGTNLCTRHWNKSAVRVFMFLCLSWKKYCSPLQTIPTKIGPNQNIFNGEWKKYFFLKIIIWNLVVQTDSQKRGHKLYFISGFAPSKLLQTMNYTQAQHHWSQYLHLFSSKTQIRLTQWWLIKSNFAKCWSMITFQKVLFIPE